MVHSTSHKNKLKSFQSKAIACIANTAGHVYLKTCYTSTWACIASKNVSSCKLTGTRSSWTGRYDPQVEWGGGTWITFWWNVWPQGLKPLPRFKFFPFKKWLILQFCSNFVKWDPLRRVSLIKMGPMTKDFWWSNPYRQHIPICLNMWVPLPGGWTPLYA